MVDIEILNQILDLVKTLKMPERTWLLARLSEVECNPDYETTGRSLPQQVRCPECGGHGTGQYSDYPDEHGNVTYYCCDCDDYFEVAAEQLNEPDRLFRLD